MHQKLTVANKFNTYSRADHVTAAQF